MRTADTIRTPGGQGLPAIFKSTPMITIITLSCICAGTALIATVTTVLNLKSNTMFNFLQTQQAQIYAGIIIALSTIIAFVITYVRNKKGNNTAFALPSRKECSLLTAENWFTIISKSIEYSANVTELKSQIDNIETFRKKKFRFHITKAERRELIEDLYTLYVEKEIELQTSISVELCNELKFIASCVLDFFVAVYVTLFCKVEVPELDEHTEAFYHK